MEIILAVKNTKFTQISSHCSCGMKILDENIGWKYWMITWDKNTG